MKKLILLSVLLIVGCAVNFQYIPYDGEKYGYRDGQFSDDTFWVEYLSWDRMAHGSDKEKYTLLRSAEITKENRFKYFVVLTKKWGVLDYVKKLDFNTTDNDKYGHRYKIQCYKEKPTNIDFNALDNYAVIYDAEMVITNYQYLYNKEEAEQRRGED